MAYNDPVSFEQPRPNVGLDSALNRLVEDFKEINWLNEKVFNRAYKFKQKGVDGQIDTEPQVYMGKGEYYSVLYNDNLPNSVFFETNGDENITFDKAVKPRIITYSRPMSLIFWGDLSRIETSYAGDYIFTESIKAEFMTVLSKNKFVRSITSYIDDPIEKVFEGYSLAEEKRHLAKFPYCGLRIEFTVEYKTGIVPC